MAIHFAGGTDTVKYADGGYVSAGCLAFRFKTSSATANVSIASIWNPSSRNGLGVLLNGTANKIELQGYAIGTPAKIDLVSTTSVNDGNWHHFAVNYNTANAGANAIFVDGTSEATGNSSAAWTFSNASGASANPLGFSITNGFWSPYVGDIAEVGLWNRQLSADEISALSKGFSPQNMLPGLVKYMPFVRDCLNLLDSLIVGPTGTTVSDHPRVMGR